ncbi:MAG TPA: lanthionine synthetase LanC family protein [Mycobacteriales bacterium]|nr:lanthionine synthetase LanC family protein [Mycobacteriales bacterium]
MIRAGATDGGTSTGDSTGHNFGASSGGRQLGLPDADLAGVVAEVAIGPGLRQTGDAGVGVLLGLVRTELPVRQALLAEWLGGLRAGAAGGGLFGGGLAGHAVGLAYAAEAEPRLAGLATRRRAALAGWAGASPWRGDAVGWADYDLMTGPAGVLLALASLPAPAPAEIRPLAEHLAGLTGDLDRLRVRRHAGDGQAAQLGHLDHGLAHGLAGVVAAMTAAARLFGPEPPGLRRAAHRLRAMSYVDSTGVASWPPSSAGADPSRPVHRQAWCYGAPGVAWALWDAGQLLGDAELTGFAAAAMASLCAAWDDDRYLYGELGDRLGVCHGAAGVLAVADAFARHAGHQPAGGLRTHLRGRIDPDRIAELGRTDLTMLNGAAGVLAVLTTVDGGRRDWLPVLGLR